MVRAFAETQDGTTNEVRSRQTMARCFAPVMRTGANSIRVAFMLVKLLSFHRKILSPLLDLGVLDER